MGHLRHRGGAPDSGAPRGEGEVVVVTAGDEDAEEAMRRCLAMGADRGVRISIEGIADRDPISIARVLAQVVEKEQPDLVFCGVQSADAVQATTGVALAELLGLPRVAVVRKLDYDHDARKARVEPRAGRRSGRRRRGGYAGRAHDPDRDQRARGTRPFAPSSRPSRRRSRRSSPATSASRPRACAACSSRRKAREPRC